MIKLKDLFKILILAVVVLAAHACSKSDDVEPIDYTPEREAGIIDDYIDMLTQEGYDVDTTSLGVYYTIITPGEGAQTQYSDSIGIAYAGFFPESGNYFDQSSYWNQDGIWRYIHPGENLIIGFNEAVSLLNVDTEALFLMPSSLAYGPYGSKDGAIPPYSPLVFVIKLVDIYE